MKIQGYFDDKFEPPAPFIRAVVVSRSLGVEQAVDLHIDTGAATSILLDKDARRLGIDAKKLKFAERSLVGIGGPVKTYVIDDAALREIMLRLPSLLGRDIIYRASFVLDKGRDEVYLER